MLVVPRWVESSVSTRLCLGAEVAAAATACMTVVHKVPGQEMVCTSSARKESPGTDVACGLMPATFPPVSTTAAHVHESDATTLASSKTLNKGMQTTGTRQ